MKSSSRLSWLLIFFCISFSGNAQDIPPTTALVYPGVDGKLVYKADSLGNKIPDFSNAGYKGGGVPIPLVPVKQIVWPVAGDNAENIQKAIDAVAALSPDASGFRGAVLLKMGRYVIEKPVYIKASGVILRGEGRSDIGTLLLGKLPRETQGPAFRRPALINIVGDAGVKPLEETKQSVVDNYVPVGATTFNVKLAKNLKVGDKILVRRIGNQDWIKAIGEDSLTVGRSFWKPFNIEYDRIITSIKVNTITIDAPIFTAIDAKWGGGEILKYEDTRIEQIGIENLRGISEYDPSIRTVAYGNMDRGNFDDPKVRYEGEEYFSDENHYANFINFGNAKNVWVRNITALHFVNSVVLVNAGTKWVTVQDCESREPVSVRAGGRRFTFQINGQLCLVQRCFSQKGRHSFVLQGSASSGNVFLECTAVNPYSTSEPHNRWVNGVLYDNVKAPLTARFWKDFPIGWAGANIVFWNCEGDFRIQKPPTAQNYSLGHMGIASVIYNLPLQDFTWPKGHIESLDRHVTPRSLYLTQLRERMGETALKNIISEY
ncbi:MAG TPA: hypothetical protein PLR06_04130 [Cyclobacteriaceae bacterium]|nr:hypothetical protein [Cyclobacteriaceae bacterium]